MKIRLALILILALAGCATAVQNVEREGAQVADGVREAAEFAICKGITVGAWVRAYASNPSKASAWRALCSIMVIEAPVPDTPAKPAP